MRLDPAYLPALSLKSTALAHLGRADEALTLAGAAVRVDATSARGYAARGAALLAAGRAREAADEFDFALQLAPTCAVVLFCAARCWARLGRAAECRETLARAVDLLPRLQACARGDDALRPYFN